MTAILAIGRKSFLMLFAALAAIFMAPTGGHGLDSLEIEIVAAVNGLHPSGTQFDGTRVYLLPIEISTISPPDWVLCTVTLETSECSSKEEDLWRPTCADAESCRFGGIVIEPTSPVGLVFFDHDGMAQDQIGEFGKALSRLGGDALENADAAPDWVSGILTTAGEAANASAKGLASLNHMRLEWIDAAILTPSSYQDGEVVKRLADRMRELIRSVAPPNKLGSSDARLSNAFITWDLEACLWPSPACPLSYVSLELKEDMP